MKLFNKILDQYYSDKLKDMYIDTLSDLGVSSYSILEDKESVLFKLNNGYKFFYRKKNALKNLLEYKKIKSILKRFL